MKKLLFPLVLISLFILAGCDRVPEFRSSPVTDAYEGMEYAYEVDVVDPDGGDVDIDLLEAPAGMQIVSRVLKWTPGFGDVGPHTVRIKASDGIKQSYQEYTLTVHYQISGGVYLLNLSDGLVFPFPNSTIRISGNGYDQSTSVATDGSFGFSDLPVGLYRFDINDGKGRSWTLLSIDRQVYFYTTTRVSEGSARLRGTVETTIGTPIDYHLLGNGRTLTTTSRNFDFVGLYPSTGERLVAKQWAATTSTIFGAYRVQSAVPEAYSMIEDIVLKDGFVEDLEFNVAARTIKAAYLDQPVPSQTMKIERNGYYMPAGNSYQIDLSRQITITNPSNPNALLAEGELHNFSGRASIGSNLERIYFWTNNNQWGSFRGVNYIEGLVEVKLGYPRNPTLDSGFETEEEITLPPVSTDKTINHSSDIENPGSKRQKSALDTAIERSSTAKMKVIKGAGLCPTFSWQHGAGELPADLFVVTVNLVDSSNNLLKTIWEGVTVQTFIDFPTQPQLLEYGNRYVMTVTAFKSTQLAFTPQNVFIYPYSYEYWFSRSEGVVFEP